MSVLNTLAVVALMVVLGCRQRWRTNGVLLAFLGAVAVGNIMGRLLPERYYTWTFWVAKEAPVHVLAFLLAVILARRVFRLFPTARVTALAGIVIVLIATAVALLVSRSAFLPPEGSTAEAIARSAFPILIGGSTWVFTVLVIVIVYFHLPVRPFDRAVILGFLAYTLIFNAALRAFWEVRGESTLTQLAEYLDALGWLGLMLWWLRAARRLPQEKNT